MCLGSQDVFSRNWIGDFLQGFSVHLESPYGLVLKKMFGVSMAKPLVWKTNLAFPKSSARNGRGDSRRGVAT